MFTSFSNDVGDSLKIATQDFKCLYLVSFRRYRPLYLPLSCEIVEKVFWPRFIGGRDTPDFGHAVSNRTCFQPRGRIWLSTVQRARRVGDKKEEERMKEWR